MGEATGVQPPEELIIELRDALAHLYDRAYLLRHPLMRYVRGQSHGDALAAVDKLKQLLCQAVEDLRPDSEVPPSDPAWRPYAVLHAKYVQGRESADIEQALSLGTRQVQREQRRGLEIIALALKERKQELASESELDAGQENALAQELARLASEASTADIASELARSLETARPLLEAYGVRVAWRRSPGEVMTVVGNPAPLRQLLVGLISLLARSVRHGWLTVQLMLEGSGVVCRLTADAGPARCDGTPAAQLPVHLSALAGVLKADVSLAAVGNSICFSLRLPRPPGERTVAVVEDNDAVVALFTRYLSGHGYRLVGVGGDSGSVEEMRRLRPDAVILDLMMQEADGWEVLRALKGDPELRSIPVVVCSVLAEQELARLLGAEAYLVKPVRPSQLRQCLAGLLQ